MSTGPTEVRSRGRGRAVGRGHTGHEKGKERKVATKGAYLMGGLNARGGSKERAWKEGQTGHESAVPDSATA